MPSGGALVDVRQLSASRTLRHLAHGVSWFKGFNGSETCTCGFPQCAVGLDRYRVVPACYRRCFPAHLKSHRSHDIVLLCIDCHQVMQLCRL
jgi:hypothetical protein